MVFLIEGVNNDDVFCVDVNEESLNKVFCENRDCVFVFVFRDNFEMVVGFRR